MPARTAPIAEEDSELDDLADEGFALVEAPDVVAVDDVRAPGPLAAIKAGVIEGVSSVTRSSRESGAQGEIRLSR